MGKAATGAAFRFPFTLAEPRAGQLMSAVRWATTLEKILG